MLQEESPVRLTGPSTSHLAFPSLWTYNDLKAIALNKQFTILLSSALTQGS